MTVVVATARSKHGGNLSCGHTAETGRPHSQDLNGHRDKQTSQGNGLGAWVCVLCVSAGDNQPSIEIPWATPGSLTKRSGVGCVWHTRPRKSGTP